MHICYKVRRGWYIAFRRRPLFRICGSAMSQARHQPKMQDHGHGASVFHGVPVYSPAYAGVPNYTAW